MGMSSHVTGFKPPDEKWKKMKSVFDACQAAKIDVPDEVLEFFAYTDPDPNGVEVTIECTACCVEWKANMRDGFQVDITKLPKDVTIIRFYNSY